MPEMKTYSDRDKPRSSFNSEMNSFSNERDNARDEIDELSESN